MGLYRKKPVVIEARQLTVRSLDNVAQWCGARIVNDGSLTGVLSIPTLEGSMLAQWGDWIIKGVAGEFYPCKNEIFAATYEAYEEEV
jgi:hypothetical protein